MYTNVMREENIIVLESTYVNSEKKNDNIFKKTTFHNFNYEMLKTMSFVFYDCCNKF